jgi:hypothetical protein
VAAPANRPAAPAQGHLQIGDNVEYDRFSNGVWGKFGTIDSFNGDPNGACPWYFVKDAVNGLILNYVCGRVRPATAAQVARFVKSSAPKVPAYAPPLGSYFCTYGLNRGQVLGPGRDFRLMPGWRYAADDDEVGTYRYDAVRGEISFAGGFFGFMKATGEFKGGKLSQIDISPAGGVVSFCSLQ